MCVCFYISLCGFDRTFKCKYKYQQKCILTVHNLCLSVHCWPEANGPCALCMAGWAVLFTLNCMNMHGFLAH